MDVLKKELNRKTLIAAAIGVCVFFVIFILIMSSSKSHATEAVAYDSMKKILEQSKTNSGYKEYGDKVIAYINQYHIDDKSGCYKHKDGAINIILMINNDGSVVFVTSDVQNEKSKCFEDVFLKVKFAEPSPYTPFYEGILFK